MEAGERLFDRDFKLVITPIGGQPFVVKPPEDSSKPLKVVADIKKVLRADPDPGMIDIYNLGPQAREALSKPFNPIKTPGAKIELYAGYKGAIGKIYSGELQEGVPELENASWILKARCGCDYYKWMRVKQSVSFKAGTDPIEAIKSLLSASGKKATITKDLAAKIRKRFENGKSFSGNLKDIMREIGRETGIVTTETSEGTTQVTEYGKPNADKPVILTEATGLLGKPKITHKGINFKCRLQPRIRPGTLVQVESKTTQAYGKYYVAQSVQINMDTGAGPWETNVEGLFYPPKFDHLYQSEV